MEMKNVYKSLNEQKLYYEQELIRKKNVLKETRLYSREYVNKIRDLDRKNVVENLRKHFYRNIV